MTVLTLQHHDGYYEDLHETVDIDVYAAKPNSYLKALKCEHHKEETITMACKTCYQFNCRQCDVNEICPGEAPLVMFWP